ncbi:MAG: high-potential iron-sulfur protein [Gammaproteobacteria bacterium]|jgi:hypothetical protein|nr:high-potential iron-sulfur protein [Gammaproteobacteria bacterium]
MRRAAPLTRRRLLRHATLLPLASLPLLPGCSESGPVACIDAELLSRGEEQMRKAREYVAVSGNPAQQCADCAFFGSVDAAGCAHCEILDGPVNATGYCTSWAQRG